MLEVLEKLNQVYSGQDLALTQKAYDYAKNAHKGQKRASGEDYFTHPCAVVKILIDLGLDAATIAAAFLHDVIEDTSVSEGDIKKEFGAEVLQLVLGVTKLERIEFHSKEEEQAENFRKIFVAMAKDIRVIIIKLADRLHNMRSLNFLSAERQLRMAQETIDIYAPLAARLGISQIKCELEDLSLKYLDPEAYEFLMVNINLKIKERNETVNFFVQEITNILKSSNITGEVFGRAKHFYSIYRKMKKQGKSLDQIYDLTAIRVVVDNIDECYEIFGKIHHKWRPVPGRIKDYIATPKANMYQSLHTTVVTNFGQIFEVQIRTYEMNRAAEFGIAAHWKYKENVQGEDDDFEKRLSWIREVMEWQGGVKDSKEFLNTLKGDIYSSEVLVFTPNGDIISLPEESTPLDFAYNIHSEVGNKCTGAKVNGKMVPLNTTLKVGDMVEIITSKNSKGPSWDWLKLVKSSSARVKIKQFFKRELKEENIKTGKSMLESEAREKGYNFNELLTDDAFLKLSSKMSFSNQNEMYASVGYGAVSTNQILVKLNDYYRRDNKEASIKKYQNIKSTTVSGVIVKGMNNILVRYAGCCNPVPGDDIVGFISKGKGVTIHRANCPNMREIESDRFIEVNWANEVANSFKASIKVVGETQSDILSAVSAITSAMNLSITAINGRIEAKTKKAIVDVNIKLNTKSDLESLIGKLKQSKKIIDVFRITT
ncbi:MAG: bifunctional (p)ppGpp synthetase/guanosine-3',5'-bis(diphosphate) 3'-pyrophosphohydrolase [Clostridia bacterium]|nr:bifunctional (p)ppGpp synthetase/guanosine-3',5'-bis(diphosphate) 3'-pyrophosphohydrolase [Clostridia bacterium]